MPQTNLLSHIKKVLRIQNNGENASPVLDSVDFYPNYYQLGDVYSSVFFLDSLPVTLYQEFLYNIINEFDLDMEIEVSEKDINTVMNRAKERLATIEAEQQDVDKRGGMRSRLKEQEYQEVDDFINLLAEGVEKPFLFSFTVTISNTNKVELLRVGRVFMDRVQNFGFRFYRGAFRQKQVIRDALPNTYQNQKFSHMVSSSVGSYLLPFNFQHIIHKNGIFYGFNIFDNSPVIYNFFSENNFSFNVIATMGGGKSATVKNIIWNERFKNFESVIIDPENEYIDLVKALGEDGDIHLADPKTPINPLKLDDYSDKAMLDHITDIKQFFALFIVESTFGKGEKLSSTLVEYYRYMIQNNQTDDISLESYLDYLDANFKQKIGYEFVGDLQCLRKNREYGRYFCGNKAFNITKKVTVYALRDVLSDALVMNSFLIIISSLLSNIARKKDKRRLLIVDEVRTFFQNEITRNILVNYGGKARKWRIGLVTITQNLTDYKESDGTIKIITNAETNIILRQTEASLDALKNTDYFNFSDQEYDLLTHASAGAGIIHRKSEHVPIQFIILPTPWGVSETTHDEDKLLKDKGIY